MEKNDSPVTLSALVDGWQYEFFGFSLPYLPDFLADHVLVGNTDVDKVQEILNRFAQFIISLRKWENCAFSLRYIAHPSRGAIDVYLICRLINEHKTQLLAQSILGELESTLRAFNLPSESLNRSDLRKVLMPLNSDPEIIEIRQHEEINHFWNMQGDVYVIHPFWKATGAWLLPFETMLRQSAEVALSVFLEPTSLTDDEKLGSSHAAQVAQTLSDQEIKTYSDATFRRRRDPQADFVASIYTAFGKQLVDPFILSIQVASSDLSAAQVVARAVGASITMSADILSSDMARDILPTGFDLRHPNSAQEKNAAKNLFGFMKFEPWGIELAISNDKTDKQRFVFLTGNKGAASAFRFPISVRGGVPGISVRQTAPDFEPGPRPLEVGEDELHLGNFRRGGIATIKLKDLTRHALITGFTGSGKTNTVLNILDQLWSIRKMEGFIPVPFLVIEAAKKEYRGLLEQPGFEDLLIFTLGDETVSPFRLNPFELLPGVRLEAHLGQLQNCFDAALPQFGILPSIIAESIEMIYRDKGWELTDICNDSVGLDFPTLNEMYQKVIQVSESRGYGGEIAQNIRAAVSGRIGSLLRGSKGKMFDCQRSLPLEILLHRPVILELNDLNQQDKSLTMMFLLMMLREYREQHKSANLQHVTVVEEAHNVLENVHSVGASEIAADTRAKAVEAFATMLAEARAYGEGIIISDQSPEKLSPDAVRNTNLQIAHQLRHRADREAIAAAMIMDEAQKEYLGKLGVGAAAVFVTGYDRATFIQIPNYKEENGFSEPENDRVKEHMAEFRQQHIRAFLSKDGCRFCLSQCKYKDIVLLTLKKNPFLVEFEDAQKRFGTHKDPDQQPENWLKIASACIKFEDLANQSGVLDVGWCYLTHRINFPFTKYMRCEFEKAHAQLK